MCWHLNHEFAISGLSKTEDPEFLDGTDSALFVFAPIYLLFPFHPDLIPFLLGSRRHLRRLGCLDVSVPIVDMHALCHTQFSFPLLVGTVPIFIWKHTHLLFSVGVVLAEKILPQAHCVMWFRPPKGIIAFPNNWLPNSIWPYQGQGDTLRFWLRCLSETESLFLLAGFEANSILSHGNRSFKLTKRKTKSKYDNNNKNHDYVNWVPKSIIPEAVAASH